MCYIWCGIFPMDFTTTIDIVPQSVAFLLQSVVFPMNFPKLIVVLCYNIY